jgi:lambda family phage tail tape measure protein
MALLASLVTRLGLESSSFSTGLKRARRQAADDTTAIRKSLDSVANAARGFAAGISLGATVAIVKKSLDYASSLQEVAQQLGVTTDALQEYRYIATQTGVDTETMDKALGKLTVSMGKARDGAKGPVATFKELSTLLGRDILKAARDAGEAIPLISDALAKVEDPTRRARLEVELFGKSGQQLDTMLAGGADAINNLRNAAHDLGIVLSEDQIQNADKTADKLAELKMILEARIAGAVADNAAAIYSLVDALATLVTWAGKASLAWRDFYLAQQMKNTQNAADRARTPQERLRLLEGVSEIADERLKISRAYAGEAQPGATKVRRPPPRLSGGAGGGSSPGRSRTPRKSGSDDGERRRKEALRDAYQFESDQRRVQTEVLQAQRELAKTAEDRLSIDKEILLAEGEQEIAALNLAVGLGDLTRAQADQLKIQHVRVDRLKRQRLDEEYQRQVVEDANKTADVRADIERERNDGLASLAETESERRAIELEILAFAYRERKAALERAQAATTDANEKSRLQLQIDALPGLEQTAQAGVMAGTRGPMESFLASLPDTAAKANEALQAVAAEGLQSITDGLTEAIMGAQSLGKVFANVAKQIIAELIKIQIQKAIIGPLANALGGAFGAGGGFNVTGFAAGGYTGSGSPKAVAGVVHGGEYVFDSAATRRLGVPTLEAIRRGSPVAAASPGSGGGGGIVINQTFAPNLAGNAVDRVELVRWMAMAKHDTMASIRDLDRRRSR